MIIALNFYINHENKIPSKKSFEIEELSITLNKLAKKIGHVGDDTLRDTNGIYRTLLNLWYRERGSTNLRIGKTMIRLWEHYRNNKQELVKLSKAILAHLAEDQPITFNYPELDNPLEGRLLVGTHLYRERNKQIVKQKKQQYLDEFGCLRCEACDFDFANTYGSRGKGFIECHHVIPLSELNVATKTKLNDLSLLCANCHRMIHSKRPWLNLENLSNLLNQSRQ